MAPGGGRLRADELHVAAIEILHHGLQHPRRRQLIGRGQLGTGGRQCRGIGLAALGGVQRLGNRHALVQQFTRPVGQGDGVLALLQQQAGLAPARSHPVLVAAQRRHLGRRVGRAVGQQTVQQKDVDEAHGGRGDAHRLERVEVHAAHLDVFHAALAQRMQRPLAGEDHPLGTDQAVELVLDLQQGGGQLVVVATRVADAHRLIGRVGPGQRLVQGVGVALQAVAADVERGLRLALVAQAAHAQRGAVRHVQGAVGGVRAGHGQQAVRAPGHEAAAHRRAGAEQVQQHKGMAAEVADQRKVLVVVQPWQAPVVVDAADGLHAPAVAVAQAHAVDALGPAHIAAAVAAQRNRLVGGQAAGHAAHPQLLVTGLAAHGAVGGLVDLGQLGQGSVHAGLHAGDQFQLALAVIGGDVRMRQRRSQRRRMRRERQPAARQGTQAFFLDAAADAGQACQRQGTQAVVQCCHWPSPRLESGRHINRGG